jgi:hypothetical protein
VHNWSRSERVIQLRVEPERRCGVDVADLGPGVPEVKAGDEHERAVGAPEARDERGWAALPAARNSFVCERERDHALWLPIAFHSVGAGLRERARDWRARWSVAGIGCRVGRRRRGAPQARRPPSAPRLRLRLAGSRTRRPVASLGVIQPVARGCADGSTPARDTVRYCSRVTRTRSRIRRSALASSTLSFPGRYGFAATGPRGPGAVRRTNDMMVRR